MTDESAVNLLQAVDAVDWTAYCLPPSNEWYTPQRVPAAFRQLLAASSQAEARAAYDELLFAVGNSHAGSVYPAAVPAAPLLVRVVREQSGWVRWAAVEVLIEFTVFGAVPAEFTDPAGVRICTKDAIRRAVMELHGHLTSLGHSPSPAPMAASVTALLRQLSDENFGL